MTDDTTDTTADEAEIDDQLATDASALAVSSTYKVRGELDADDGAGVLGKNTADSGTPIGVEGAVPNNSSGYGLSTPGDARVGGTAELAALAGALTGNQQITDLLGDGLAVSSGALSADPARPDLDDGSTSVADADALTLGSGLTLSDDGDGTATVQVAPDWTDPRQTLTAGDGDGDDEFGEAVALSDDGTTALVGAPGDEDPNGANAGSAYVFEYDGGWSEVTKLSASDGTDDDRFGFSVALSDDGTSALVGTESVTPPANAAYVFDGSGGWSGVSTESKKLTPGDGDSNAFGSSVALSGDGTVAVVGAPSDDDKATGAGSAYVFEDDGGWSEVTELFADDADADDGFGGSVALSDDATTVLVGAPGDEDPNGTSAGSAYVFEESGGWSEVTKLSASDGGKYEFFGASVALSGGGSTALVGTDSNPYVFEEGGGWGSVTTETVKLPDGTRIVSLSDDGNFAITGEYNTNTGQAYVYDATGGWSSVTGAIRTVDDGSETGRFGTGVAMSGDRTTALIGDPREDIGGSSDVGKVAVVYAHL